jgi:three-Cys-motif partner protein
MAANDDFFKGIKPAAVLKHSLLNEYLTVFAAKIGKFANGPMWLIDGYAGPGVYEADDEGGQVPGSPVIALDIADKVAGYPQPRDLRCCFIEGKASFYKSLAETVKPYQDRGREVHLYKGDVTHHFPDACARASGSPLLAFLDPFGVSMDRSTMVDAVCARGSLTTEVMLNINVEAVSRHGGYLQKGADGRAEVRSHLRAKTSGVEKTDRFLGGTWWRDRFVQARENLGGSATAAADAVIADYIDQVGTQMSMRAIYVPIRRKPQDNPLFQFTLFYTHDSAGYAFADAASRASRKWREAYRQQDLQDRIARDSGDQMFDLFKDIATDDSEKQARESEGQIDSTNLQIVTNNIRELLNRQHSIAIGPCIADILGTSLSLAGESILKRAWKQLSDEQLVLPRDTSKKSLWNQSIVKR